MALDESCQQVDISQLWPGFRMRFLSWAAAQWFSACLECRKSPCQSLATPQTESNCQSLQYRAGVSMSAFPSHRGPGGPGSLSTGAFVARNENSEIVFSSPIRIWLLCQDDCTQKSDKGPVGCGSRTLGQLLQNLDSKAKGTAGNSGSQPVGQDTYMGKEEVGNQGKKDLLEMKG